MQLKQVKVNADNLAGKGSDIRDVVITYPSFYTAEEKRSLELAAELAGLNVDAFVSEGLAVHRQKFLNKEDILPFFLAKSIASKSDGSPLSSVF